MSGERLEAEPIVTERFTLRSVTITGPWSVGWHVHATAHLAFILEGLIVDGHEASSIDILEPHTAIFRPPGYRHRNQSASARTRLLVADFGPDTLRVFCPIFGGPPQRVLFPFSAFGSTMVRLLEELAIRDTVTPVAVDGLLTELIAFAGRMYLQQQEGAHRPRWMTTVAAFVETHIASRLRLRDAARLAGLSDAQFSTRFRHAYGMGFAGYVRRRRVELAAAAILSTTERLTDIAHSYGFVDQAHLTRAFKEVWGMTPARFRERFRGLDGYSVPEFD